MRDSRPRPSTHLPVPADVADILLWQLAADVAATHRPGDHGRCTSPLCTGQPAYPCPPAAAARRAAHAARRPAPTARGRAAVPTFTATGRSAPSGAGAAVTTLTATPSSAYESDVWPPPLRRPIALQAA